METKSENEVKIVSPEQAAIDKQEEQLKLAKCSAEINAICKKYGMALKVSPPQVILVSNKN